MTFAQHTFVHATFVLFWFCCKNIILEQEFFLSTHFSRPKKSFKAQRICWPGKGPTLVKSHFFFEQRLPLTLTLNNNTSSMFFKCTFLPYKAFVCGFLLLSLVLWLPSEKFLNSSPLCSCISLVELSIIMKVWQLDYRLENFLNQGEQGWVENGN